MRLSTPCVVTSTQGKGLVLHYTDGLPADKKEDSPAHMRCNCAGSVRAAPCHTCMYLCCTRHALCLRKSFDRYRKELWLCEWRVCELLGVCVIIHFCLVLALCDVNLLKFEAMQMVCVQSWRRACCMGQLLSLPCLCTAVPYPFMFCTWTKDQAQARVWISRCQHDWVVVTCCCWCDDSCCASPASCWWRRNDSCCAFFAKLR